MFQESGIVFLLQVSSVTSSSVAAASRALLICSAIRCQCHVEFFLNCETMVQIIQGTFTHEI